MLEEFRKKLKYQNIIFDLTEYKAMNKRIQELDYSEYCEKDFKVECLNVRSKIKTLEHSDEVMVEVYALIKEAIYRTLKIHPYDVQIIAAIAMYQGKIIEMKTGEGKTLAGVFLVCLNALMGHKVNVLTANDYLAKRDCEWMGDIYRYFGLTVGYICETMPRNRRREVYKNDIVYLTVKESGFDYLKNFLCVNKEKFIERELDFALIDEADSILIDEARIPLVIAGIDEENRNDNPFYLLEFIENLKQNEDYELSDFNANISLTDNGTRKCEKFLDIDVLYSSENIAYLADVTNALEAEYLYKKDIDYIVKDSTVYQVDMLTGRVAENRQWPEGLQEAIEAKERIKPKAKSKILAQISVENFVKLYSKVTGMTGTVISSADEINEKYNLDIVEIPTNKKCIRVDQDDYIFVNKEAKYKALIDKIIKVHKSQRPILIGTYSVEESEFLAEQLKDRKIECQVLNAKNNELEAHIVAEAGGLGAVTVSTNMAGRGTDIKLGGKEEKYKDEVMKLGGLYVIGTNRHNSIRIDNQLRGRAARQGECGESRFFVSLEDDLLRKYGLDKFISKSLHAANEKDLIDNKVIKRQVNVAQRIAQGNDQRIRTNITKYSLTLEKQRQEIGNIREEILFGKSNKEIIKERLPGRYQKLSEQLGEEAIKKAERQVLLYFIDKHWASYLENAAYLRQTIYLVNLGKKDPIFEHDKIIHEGYGAMLEEIYEDVISKLKEVKIDKNGINMEKQGMRAPSSTLTFLLDDSAEALGMDTTFGNPMAAFLMGPFLVPAMIYKKIMNKKKSKTPKKERKIYW